jgi:hypothetical protein
MSDHYLAFGERQVTVGCVTQDKMPKIIRVRGFGTAALSYWKFSVCTWTCSPVASVNVEIGTSQTLINITMPGVADSTEDNGYKVNN